MPVTARSTPNIALIKYWGNRNDALRLCAADSLSMALDQPGVEVTVDHSPTLTILSFEPDGSEKVLGEKHLERFRKHLELTKRYLEKLEIPDAIPNSVSLTIRSQIPPGIGLASSSAVFSALAEAYAGLIKRMRTLSRKEISVIGRLGSGSAARGAFDGYSAIHAGEGNEIDADYAYQVAPPEHWLLHDIIIVPSKDEKKYGSTEGHAFAGTSPLFAQRLKEIPHRQRECIDAIKTKDFEKLQRVAEDDCLNMHEIMRTSTPSLQYLSEDTFAILDALKKFRASEHVPVLFTMDAGPTVHLFCLDETVTVVREFARSFKNFQVFEAKTGYGSSLV